MKNIPEDFWEKALKITSLFEGGEPTSAVDSGILSMGVVQWTMQTALPDILIEVFETYPYMTRCYGCVDFYSALKKGEGKRYAKQVINGGGSSFVGDWYERLYNLTYTYEFQSISLKYLKDWKDQTVRLCERYGLWDDRSVALFFDVSIQNWDCRLSVDKNLSREEKLIKIANLVSNQSDPRWKNDVSARKMAIVNGRDMGRGWDDSIEFYDLDGDEMNKLDQALSEIEVLKAQIEKLNKLIFQGTVGQEGQWKEDGVVYLKDNGFIKSDHPSTEVVDLGTLGTMFKNRKIGKTSKKEV